MNNSNPEKKPEDHRPTVLIVEDDEADAHLLNRQLKLIWPDSVVMTVQSLQDAYSACRKNSIDLLLLDLNLPDGHGPATVQEVRKFNKSVPIVVVTGMQTNVAVCEALKLGANNVVLKSEVTSPDFINILEQNTH